MPAQRRWRNLMVANELTLDRIDLIGMEGVICIIWNYSICLYDIAEIRVICLHWTKRVKSLNKGLKSQYAYSALKDDSVCRATHWLKSIF